jgi:uncharacterized protein YutD
MVADYSFDQLQTIKGFFTEDQWNAIDAALSDYQDYGDCETQLSESIRDKIRQLYN